jgi:hypothetical protein
LWQVAEALVALPLLDREVMGLGAPLIADSNSALVRGAADS